MNSIFDKCCDKCTHTPETPCINFVKCLSEGPLCHESESCKAEKKALLEKAIFADCKEPVFFIGTGTCGLAAGAMAVLEELKKNMSESGREIKIIEVGCIGYCAVEPLIDVQLPGYKRVLTCELSP